ncbi:MAG TPA: hypothetical protein VL418_01680 [Devosiaceae bacterium]|nr:hypothetical protein [Devosiaceae bacterium]
MTIESMMYFALGVLASALLALMLMPAIWRRAVRLTKKRIEAATPLTLAEFRADKDQLRAEFALSTRRLEMNVEQLRKRLTEQLGATHRGRDDLDALKSERDEHAVAARELEEREAVLRERILDLERESAELAQRLTQRDRELEKKSSQLEDAREAIRMKLPPSSGIDGKGLTGNYDEDIDELLTALTIERKRVGALEQQARGVLAQLDLPRSAETNSAIAELRRSLGVKREAGAANASLVEAEVRIAKAESRLTALLEETNEITASGTQKHDQPLAEKLSLEAQVEQLRSKVVRVEATVLADWDTERLEQTHLRERLNDIASDVSRLVYAVETQAPPDTEESLFDRVQRFADDGAKLEAIPMRNGAAGQPLIGPVALPRPGNVGAQPRGRGSVADRMAALRELQGRR